MTTKGRSTRRWKKLRRQILAECDICWLCGHPGADSLDHVIPLSVMPELAENIDNLRPAHYRPCPFCGKRCNSSRGSRWPGKREPSAKKSREW